MNGAAMNCRQGPGLRPQDQDSTSLHNPGYHLQINRHQNLQPQNSKILNHPSFSTNYQVDGVNDNLDYHENTVDSRHSITNVKDPRYLRPKSLGSRSGPIDLPVPQFEIDEHSVSGVLVGSEGLDLDTRIGLLIKSKALAGMHPIFSDLNETEESDSDYDDPFLTKPKPKFKKEDKTIPSPPRNINTPLRESFDDPEKPLSRPPSPFLSRATYLFWFNKAIEIKQQARAQEQALLEQAAKRLVQDTSPSLKTNQPERVSKKMPRPKLKSLMDEISKELKEVFKQEFLREVIEQMALNTFDDWWEKHKQEEKCDVLKNESEHLESVKSVINDDHQESFMGNSEYQGSTSPKMPFPWKEQNKSQDDNSVKGTFYDEKMSEKLPLRGHHNDSFDNAHTVPKESIQSNLNADIKPRISTVESLHNQCEINAEEVCSEVKGNNLQIDACDVETVNSVSAEMPKSDICGGKILIEKNEASQSLHSDVSNNLVGDKTDEKFAIVKDILDFIFNNVNNIVVHRNDDENSEKEVNKNSVCQNYSKLTGSVDKCMVSETKQLDPCGDFC